MNKNHILFQIKTSSAVLLLLIICCLSLFMMLYSDYQLDKKKYDKLSSQNSVLMSQINYFHKHHQQIEQKIKIWKEISSTPEFQKGLIPSQAAYTFKQLQKIYMLRNVRTNLSMPEYTKDLDLRNDARLMSSVISFSFECINDKYVYKILDDIKRNLPGYIQITYLSITKISDIDKDHLSRISAGHNPSTIKADIIFNWMCFKGKST